jgi:hypothetical protein
MSRDIRLTYQVSTVHAVWHNYYKLQVYHKKNNKIKNCLGYNCNLKELCYMACIVGE